LLFSSGRRLSPTLSFPFLSPPLFYVISFSACSVSSFASSFGCPEFLPSCFFPLFQKPVCFFFPFVPLPGPPDWALDLSGQQWFAVFPLGSEGVFFFWGPPFSPCSSLSCICSFSYGGVEVAILLTAGFVSPAFPTVITSFSFSKSSEQTLLAKWGKLHPQISCFLLRTGWVPFCFYVLFFSRSFGWVFPNPNQIGFW